MYTLTCRACDPRNGDPRGNPSQTYLCPKCGYGWNNNTYGRHGTAESLIKAFATNSLVIIMMTAGVNLRWSLWPILVTAVCVYGGAWLLGTVASLVEDHYDPPESRSTSLSVLGDYQTASRE